MICDIPRCSYTLRGDEGWQRSVTERLVSPTGRRPDPIMFQGLQVPPNLCTPLAGREQSVVETGERGDLCVFLQCSLLLCIQLDGKRIDVFFEMGDRTGAGNQDHLR